MFRAIIITMTTPSRMHTRTSNERQRGKRKPTVNQPQPPAPPSPFTVLDNLPFFHTGTSESGHAHDRMNLRSTVPQMRMTSLLLLLQLVYLHSE